MAAELTLYYAQVCPFAQRSSIILNFKKVKYEAVAIDLANKPDWFLKVSPFGKVPVLKHNDKIIYESSVISEYVEELLPTPALLPEEPYGRALNRIWIKYTNDTFIPTFYKLLKTHEPQEQAQLRKNLIESLYFIENEGFAKHSGNGPYFFGKNISLFDTELYPFFERFVVNEYYSNVKIPQECSKLRNWIKIMRTLPEISITSNPVDYYLKYYNKYADKNFEPGARKVLDDLWK